MKNEYEITIETELAAEVALDVAQIEAEAQAEQDELEYLAMLDRGEEY